MALNGATPTELANLCPFVERTYPIHLGRGADPLQRQLFPGLAAYYDACERLEARQGRGFAGYQTPPAYRPGEHFRLTLPASHTAWPSNGPRIAILPGGSAPRSYYPSRGRPHQHHPSTAPSWTRSSRPCHPRWISWTRR